MEVGAGGIVRNDRHIGDLSGDPEVEFAKAVLRASGKYVDPHWTKERLFYELQQISQAAALSAYLRRAAAEDGEKQQLEHAMMASYRRGTAPQDLLQQEPQDHSSPIRA